MHGGFDRRDELLPLSLEVLSCELHGLRRNQQPGFGLGEFETLLVSFLGDRRDGALVRDLGEATFAVDEVVLE